MNIEKIADILTEVNNNFFEVFGAVNAVGNTLDRLVELEIF